METRLNTGQLLNQLLHTPQHAQAKTTQTAATRVTSSDSFNSQILADPQKFLQQNLTDKLNETLAKYGLPPATELDADEFTPDKVADRILGFVGNTLIGAQTDGADNEKLNSLFNAAQQGIRQGLEEARDILKSLDVLNGKVAEDVDSTEDLLSKGMEDLYKTLFGSTEETAPTTSKTQTNTTQQSDSAARSSNIKAAEYASYQRDDSFSFQLTTQQGDVVTLKFQNSNAAYDATSFHSTAGQQRLSQSSGVSASSELSFEVDGDLNDSELAAINALVQDVSGIAEDFFANDVEGAFEAALQLGFDGSQIASFNLNLQRSETTQYAQTYQRNQHPHLSGPNVPGPIQSMAQVAEKFANGLHNRPLLDQLLPSQRQSATDLLQQLTEQDSRYQQMTEQVKQNANQALQAITGGLTDQFLNQLNSVTENLA